MSRSLRGLTHPPCLGVGAASPLLGMRGCESVPVRSAGVAREVVPVELVVVGSGIVLWEVVPVELVMVGVAIVRRVRRHVRDDPLGDGIDVEDSGLEASR